MCSRKRPRGDKLSEKIGQIVLKLPMLAATLRHTRPYSTLRDYLHVDPDAPLEDRQAIELLRDIMLGRTTEIIEKWYDKSTRSRFAESRRGTL